MKTMKIGVELHEKCKDIAEMLNISLLKLIDKAWGERPDILNEEPIFSIEGVTTMNYADTITDTAGAGVLRAALRDFVINRTEAYKAFSEERFICGTMSLHGLTRVEAIAFNAETVNKRKRELADEEERKIKDRRDTVMGRHKK